MLGRKNSEQSVSAFPMVWRTFYEKVMLFILVLCVVIATLGCAPHPSDDWQTINIPKCGTLRIPKEWRMFEQDDRIHIVDAEDRPIMIETHSYCGVDDGDEGETESNAYFKNVTNIKYLKSAVLSNGAIYGEVLVSYENLRFPKYYLGIGYYRNIRLVVWDETMDEEMLLDIAETFVIE